MLGKLESMTSCSWIGGCLVVSSCGPCFVSILGLVNLLNHLSMNHITVLFFLPQQATTTGPVPFPFLDNGFRFLPESDLSEFSLILLTTNFLVTQIVINESV
jgi:hypothetical protein